MSLPILLPQRLFLARASPYVSENPFETLGWYLWSQRDTAAQESPMPLKSPPPTAGAHYEPPDAAAHEWVRNRAAQKWMKSSDAHA